MLRLPATLLLPNVVWQGWASADWRQGISKCIRQFSKSPHKLSEVLETLPAHHVASSGLWGPRFDNPWPTWSGNHSFAEIWKYAQQRKQQQAGSTHGWLLDNPNPTDEDFRRAFPVSAVNATALARPPAAAVQATWLGHASMLVQMEGMSWLIDPIFSERCSPSQYFGPRRVVPTVLTADDPALPHLDFVLISHNHYDHLDHGTVMALHRRFGDRLVWYVPLGVRSWFVRQGLQNVVQLDWWQQVQHGHLTIALTPAQHSSSRYGLDRCHSLWGGFAVQGHKLRFWYAGDTGYCPVFPEIGARYGPFDLAAIPTGAYAPRWMMKSQHVDPHEAVQVHQEVGSMRSIAVHCCTFNLSLEALDEPPKLLAEAVAGAQLPSDSFVTLQHGGTLQTAGGRDLNAPKLLG